MFATVPATGRLFRWSVTCILLAKFIIASGHRNASHPTNRNHRFDTDHFTTPFQVQPHQQNPLLWHSNAFIASAVNARNNSHSDEAPLLSEVHVVPSVAQDSHWQGRSS